MYVDDMWFIMQMTLKGELLHEQIQERDALG